MLIRGNHLGLKLRGQVLAMYVHRWTHENAKQTYGGKCPACEQSMGHYPTTKKRWHARHKPLTTDAVWLTEHAFEVTKQGELNKRQRYAESAYIIARKDGAK